MKIIPSDNATIFVAAVHSLICVARMNGEYGVFARESIRAGQTLFRIEGEYKREPSRYSVQVGWRIHIDSDGNKSLEELLDRRPWRFTNHSCDANTMVRRQEVVAIRMISAGEEVTLNYNATEYQMAFPFTCRCGSLSCVGRISGFRYLSHSEQERLRPFLNDYLQNLTVQVKPEVREPAWR